APSPPRGPQLTSPAPANTLAGVGADDVMPLELVELPGAATAPEMDAVSSLPSGGVASAASELAASVPFRPASATRPERTASPGANGAGLPAEAPPAADPAVSTNPFAPTLPELLPVDPKRFPQLAAEDALLEDEARAPTLPATFAVSAT